MDFILYENCNFVANGIFDGDGFLKKNYPLVIIAVGFFLTLFPFGMIGAEQLKNAFVFYGFSAVLVAGFVLYYKKRRDYSAKTRKVVKMAAIAIPLFLVAAVIFGAVLGISNALYKSSLEPSKNLDRDLFEQKIVDWVNTHRSHNNMDIVTLDPTLNNLAHIRSMNLLAAYPAYIEASSDIDINKIAKREGIECTTDGKSVPIYDYVILVPPKSYANMDKVVDFIMTYTVDHGNENLIFRQNVTKTGIDTFVAGSDLFVVQNFC